MSDTQLFSQEEVNLHTHSVYCGHGSGTIAEYVQQAKEQGLKVLGLSEHCPVPENRWGKSRMAYDLLEAYDHDCRTAQLQEQDLLVLRAGEVDYLKEYHDFYQQRYVEELQLDYLFFGIHYLQLQDRADAPVHHGLLDKAALHAYTDQYVAAIASGLFLFGAHPDLFAFNYRPWDAEAKACSRAILEAAVQYKLPLEINGYGFRKPQVEAPQGLRLAYPLREFWEMAATYPVLVTTNSDAHSPQDVNVHTQTVKEYARSLGLEFVTIQLRDKGSRHYQVKLLPHQGV